MTEPPEALPGHDRRSRLLGNRGFLISTASTIVFFAVVTVILVAAPGFDAVRESFFNLEAMKESFFGVPEEGLPGIGQAFLLNIRIFLIAEVLILIFALVIAVIRSLPGPVFFPFRMLAIVYTDLFRGMPLLLVIYLFGFGLPALGITRPVDPVGGRVRDRGTGPVLLGLRRRGVPGRDRVGAPEPGRGRAIPRPVSRCSRSASSCCRRPSAGSSRRSSTTS